MKPSHNKGHAIPWLWDVYTKTEYYINILPQSALTAWFRPKILHSGNNTFELNPGL